VTVQVLYTTDNPVDDTLSGLNFYVHYDSSELSLPEGSEENLELGGDPARLPGGPGDTGFQQVVDNVPDNDIPDINDTGDDGDPDTDRAIQVSFAPTTFDFPNENTDPSGDGVLLYTAEFTTSDQFDGATLNVTGAEDNDPDTEGVQSAFDAETGALYTLQAEPGVIALEGGNGDGEGITVALSIDPTTGSEADGTTFTLTATASEAVTEEQTVGLALSGDADADDFTGDLPGTIAIADGDTTGTVEVTVNDDDVEEGEETATFTISNPSDGIELGGTVEASATIADNDDDGEPTEPTVELSINPTTGSEEDTTQFTLTATASAAVSGEQTVDLALGADAEAADFGGNVPPQITIADGQTTGTVDVTVNDDDVEEGEETATFTISNPSDGIALGDPVEASATIADNDAVEPTEPTVELSVDPTEGSEEGETVFTLTAEASEAVTGEQTVDLALSGDADADDFVGDLPAAITIADGQTTGTVDVTVNDDDVEEGEETANFALESPPEGFVLGANTNVDITIEDNDAADTPPAEDLQGDFNDDGITNLNDLGLFAAAFGSSEGDPNFDSIFDLGGDEGLINNDDLSQLGTIFAEEFVA
jgi:hypothetical protein